MTLIRSRLAVLLAASLGALTAGGCEPIGDAPPIDEPPAPPAPPVAPVPPGSAPTSDSDTVKITRSLTPSAIGRLYFKHNGQIAVGIDAGGNLYSPSAEQGAVGGTPFTAFPGLVFKKSGTALYGFERSSSSDIDQLGRILIRNNYLAELVSTMPLPGETGVLLLKNAGVAVGEFDNLDNGGSLLIHGQIVRFFKYRKNALNLLPIERTNFVDAILYLNGQRFGGTECGATSSWTDGMGNGHPYMLPGHVSFYAKSDEAHANTHSHNNRNLLPWHRAFLSHIEGQIRAYDPTVSIPYWEWETTPHGWLMYPSMDGFMGHPNNTVCARNSSYVGSYDGVNCVPDGDGNSYGYQGLDDSDPNQVLDLPWATTDPVNHPVANPLYDPSCSTACTQMGSDPCTNRTMCPNPCRENTLTRYWNTAYSPKGISLWYSEQLANPGASGAELAELPYEQMADLMNVIHVNLHSFLGHDVGDLGPFETSARVPILYLMHANIDRFWAEWQKNPAHPGRLILGNSEAYGTATSTPLAGETIEGINSSLEPWADTPPMNDVFYRHSRPFLASTAECGPPPTMNPPLPDDSCTGDTAQRDVKTSANVSILTPPLYQ